MLLRGMGIGKQCGCLTFPLDGTRNSNWIVVEEETLPAAGESKRWRVKVGRRDFEEGGRGERTECDVLAFCLQIIKFPCFFLFSSSSQSVIMLFMGGCQLAPGYLDGNWLAGLLAGCSCWFIDSETFAYRRLGSYAIGCCFCSESLSSLCSVCIVRNWRHVGAGRQWEDIWRSGGPGEMERDRETTWLTDLQNLTFCFCCVRQEPALCESFSIPSDVYQGTTRASGSSPRPWRRRSRRRRREYDYCVGCINLIIYTVEWETHWMGEAEQNRTYWRM